MKKISILFIVITFVILSCKNDNKQNPKKDVKLFKVSFEMINKQPDTLQFFYINDKTWNFKEEFSLKSSIKGDSLPQFVTFEIPDGYTPTYIRLDFNNSNSEIVFLNNIKIEYGDKVLVEKDSLLTKYFAPNNVEFKDSLNQIILSKDKVDPFIYSNDIFKEKMILLTK